MNVKIKAEYLQEILEWELVFLEAKTACYKHGWEYKIPALDEALERMKTKLKELYGN